MVHQFYSEYLVAPPELRKESKLQRSKRPQTSRPDLRARAGIGHVGKSEVGESIGTHALDFLNLQCSPAKAFLKLNNHNSKKNYRNLTLKHQTTLSQSNIKESLAKRQSRPMSSVRSQASHTTRTSSKKAYPDGEQQIEFWKVMNQHKDKYVSDVAFSKF
jgi:hypothetical protein